MPDTPVIGLTCFITPPDRERGPRVAQNLAYVRALQAAGAAPCLISDILDRRQLETLYGRLDGLLLPGGPDVDPACYGQARHAMCGPSVAARDETELALARWAIEHGLPLLAICRGIQVLNVALGGSLYQDIESQVGGAKHDWYPGYPRTHIPHHVDLVPGTRLAALMGTHSLPVNSLHHQALEDLAPNLTLSARAPDGIVEAVELADHPFALAVQWHPEELAPSDPLARRLFEALISAARET